MTSHVAGLYSFRSVLPEICPFKMASIFWLTSPSETSSVKSSRHSSFHSLANLSQSFNLGGMGHCTESIPSKDTPRKINGNTLTLRSAEAVSPQHVTAPPYWVAFMAVQDIHRPRYQLRLHIALLT